MSTPHNGIFVHMKLGMRGYIQIESDLWSDLDGWLAEKDSDGVIGIIVHIWYS